MRNPYIDPQIHTITAPLNANVWKIIARGGDTVKIGDTIVILEAMKLEIAVKAENDMVGGKVEKLTVRPGDVVKAGDVICLVRKK